MIPTSWRVVTRTAEGDLDPLTDWLSFEEAESALADLLVEGQTNLRLESSDHQFCTVYGGAVN